MTAAESALGIRGFHRVAGSRGTGQEIDGLDGGEVRIDFAKDLADERDGGTIWRVQAAVE